MTDTGWRTERVARQIGNALLIAGKGYDGTYWAAVHGAGGEVRAMTENVATLAEAQQWAERKAKEVK